MLSINIEVQGIEGNSKLKFYGISTIVGPIIEFLKRLPYYAITRSYVIGSLQPTAVTLHLAPYTRNTLKVNTLKVNT